MNKEKIVELEKVFNFFTLKGNDVCTISFHLDNGEIFSIGYSDVIEKIIALCLNETERQIYLEEFGDYPENLDQTREFQAAKTLASAVNDYSFNPKRFAETLPYIHRTLQQNIFRLLVAIIEFMADDNYRTDLRNQASHEISKKLAVILEREHIPFI